MKTAPVDEIVRDCLAVRTRLVGRAVSNIYDHALERHGLTIAQLNLLAAVGKLGACAPAHLSQVLNLERSTLSRNLMLLLKREWIEVATADARGMREVTLTAAGRAKVASVMPDWRAAQRDAADLLGGAGVQAVRSVARELSHLPGD